MDLAEVRSVRLVPLPALSHQVVDLPRAVRGLWQGPVVLVAVVEIADVFDDLLVCQFAEGLVSGKGEDLPHGHRESPDVALGCELALEYQKDAIRGVYLCIRKSKTLSE